MKNKDQAESGTLKTIKTPIHDFSKIGEYKKQMEVERQGIIAGLQQTILRLRENIASAIGEIARYGFDKIYFELQLDDALTNAAIDRDTASKIVDIRQICLQNLVRNLKNWELRCARDKRILRLSETRLARLINPLGVSDTEVVNPSKVAGAEQERNSSVSADG